jgi:hypothetical protein
MNSGEVREFSEIENLQDLIEQNKEHLDKSRENRERFYQESISNLLSEKIVCLFLFFFYTCLLNFLLNRDGTLKNCANSSLRSLYFFRTGLFILLILKITKQRVTIHTK